MISKLEKDVFEFKKPRDGSSIILLFFMLLRVTHLLQSYLPFLFHMKPTTKSKSPKGVISQEELDGW